jgi:protein-L-isoaspartate(D-aspartate) O-methyltransferase
VTEVTVDSARAAELQGRLADELVAEGTIVSKEVESAFRTVPRHLFAPGVTLEKAYAQGIVATKRDEHGVTTSSVSAPRIQAMMLEQAELRPGMRGMEIGSGGYNAALMVEIVGEAGEITTIDIDADVIGRARQCLAEAGYDHVNVVLTDGEQGCAQHAPYDRAIVTVGAWDIPPAWVDQLADGGTITVPLRMRGLTRSITFEREGDHLVSRSAKVCGFVKMQGAGAYQERLLLLRGNDEIGLRFDDGLPADADRLNGALDTDRTEAWSGVTVGKRESFETLQLWLASALDGFCQMAVDRELDTGLVSPQNHMACPAVVKGSSFAYLAVRKVGDDPDRPAFEFGAHAFGPDATSLAQSVAEQVRVWDRDHRGGPGPRFAAYPADTPDEQLPKGRVIDKRHTRITISWPSAGLPPVGQDVLNQTAEKKE